MQQHQVTPNFLNRTKNVNKFEDNFAEPHLLTSSPSTNSDERKPSNVQQNRDPIVV